MLRAECYVLGLQLFLAGTGPKAATETTTLWTKLAARLQLKFGSREIRMGRRRDSIGRKQKHIKIFGRTTDESSSVSAGQELVSNLML